MKVKVVGNDTYVKKGLHWYWVGPKLVRLSLVPPKYWFGKPWKVIGRL